MAQSVASVKTTLEEPGKSLKQNRARVWEWKRLTFRTAYRKKPSPVSKSRSPPCSSHKRKASPSRRNKEDKGLGLRDTGVGVSCARKVAEDGRRGNCKRSLYHTVLEVLKLSGYSGKISRHSG